MRCGNLKYIPDVGVRVPCGKCLACLSNKRNDWIFRLQQEFRASRNGALFVTLTYDWKHLPKDGSLNKRDLQLFFKRLRQRDYGTRLRYYAVGEYGTKGNRPHYHILLFNADERLVRQSWELGIVHCGTVTPASVAYCTKYLVQPFSPVKGLSAPFSVMSRGYGIGGHYLSDDVVRWHLSGDKNFAIVDRQKVRLPRYYRDKIWCRFSDKSRIQVKSKRFALSSQATQKESLKALFGDEWERRYSEMRNAELSRIKLKVAFTQSL